MAHHTAKNGYVNLVERINKFPLGAPASETLYKILSLLFSPKEAELVALLPIKPFTVQSAARVWKKNENEARKILENLASRALLLDMESNEETMYVLPPPMAGFFEFTLMRVGGELDQKVISELFNQYLNVEDDFVKALFHDAQTKLGRTFVNEKALSQENMIHVLDYEKASEVIQSSKFIGVSTCYCRHKKHHLGTACDAPMEVCMTFGDTAKSLNKHGYARKIDSFEAMDKLQLSYKHNLIQLGENAKNNVSFICNCCGCCCEALTTAKRFAHITPVETSNFLPYVNSITCNGCSKCAKVCPVDAIDMITIDDNKIKKALVDESKCLGCGICITNCKQNAMILKQKEKRVLTPVNSAHKYVLMAIEKGLLQNLIFDNQALLHHRVMATILGVILKLPPIKQAMASEQMRSRYLSKMLESVSV